MDSVCAKSLSSSASKTFAGSTLRYQSRTVAARSSSNVPQIVALDFSKVLGGRGLVREDVLKGDKANEVLWYDAVKPPKDEKKEVLPASEPTYGTFGKEMDGLTGGFPGGEKGLMKFLEENPLPKAAKLSSELERTRLLLQETTKAVASESPRPFLPPLLMPGMTVRVVNSKDAYFQFTGIVQRVTDGRVGVLFEGGNWDKMVTFDISDLERTKKGPPGSNPKSASLELDPAFQQ